MNDTGTLSGNSAISVPSPTEARRLKREAKAREIIKSIKGDRWRPKAATPEPITIIDPKPGEYVYFMYSAGLIKIGYTGDIYKRLASIKNMGGARLELIGVIPGNKQSEKLFHQMFKADRKHGEWFHPSAEIRRFLGCLDDAVMLTFPPESALAAGSCIARLQQAEARA